MDTRLTQNQLAAVIAEIERLSQKRSSELNSEQVKEILQELNLPSDLLEDALVQLRRREALAKQQQKNWLIVAGAAIFLIGAIATTTVWQQRHQQQMAQVSTIQSRITLTDNGGSLNQIDRQTNPKVYYRVTLKDAPVSRRLSLTCDWVAPNNQVVHQSRYQTQQITQPVWTTYCYHQLKPSAAIGDWEVKMFLEGRLLSSKRFVVASDKPAPTVVK